MTGAVSNVFKPVTDILGKTLSLGNNLLDMFSSLLSGNFIYYILIIGAIILIIWIYSVVKKWFF